MPSGPRTLVALLVGIQLGSVRALKVPLTRASFIQTAGLSLLTPPAAHAEMFTAAGDCTGVGMCSGSAKTSLAAYDEMLLKKTTEELNEMSEGASAAKTAGYDECKRLVNLVLELDWRSLDDAAKKLDQSLGSTQRLNTGIKKKDPKVTAKAVLEIAEDLDVSGYTSAGTGQPASAPPAAGNPFDPRLQK